MNSQNKNMSIKWLAIPFALFAAVHGILLVLGVRFETYPLYAFLHFIDPELLRTRLLESCFYLHIQPPLFNLFCGVILKAFGSASDSVFRVIYVLLGFALYVSVFFLMLRLGVRRWLALVLSTLFMASSAFILYEHWLFYTLPSALLLVISALCLHRMVVSGGYWAAVGFFGSLFMLAGIRSSYHISYFVVVLIATVAVCAGFRKRMLSVGLVFLVLVVGMNAKNYALFGFFGTSSLLGKNMYINTVGNMRYEDRERLARKGKLSELALYNRWNCLDNYPDKYRRADGFENIPVLRRENKSHGPHNYNHLAHIAISNQYMADSLVALRESPKSFVLAMAYAGYTYFRPASDYTCSNHNTAIIGPWKEITDYAFGGRLDIDVSSLSFLSAVVKSPPHVILLLGLPLIFLLGLHIAYWGTLGKTTFTRAQRILLAYFCFNIFYVAAVGIALDFNETNRYRFETDAFSLCILGIIIQTLLPSSFFLRRKKEAKKNVSEWF